MAKRIKHTKPPHTVYYEGHDGSEPQVVSMFCHNDKSHRPRAIGVCIHCADAGKFAERGAEGKEK